MNEINSLQVWVVVRVESGVTSEVGVYPNLTLAKIAENEMKSDINPDDDDLQTLGPFDVKVATHNDL
jgi:hypothetical protein